MRMRSLENCPRPTLEFFDDCPTRAIQVISAPLAGDTLTVLSSPVILGVPAVHWLCGNDPELHMLGIQAMVAIGMMSENGTAMLEALASIEVPDKTLDDFGTSELQCAVGMLVLEMTSEERMDFDEAVLKLVTPANGGVRTVATLVGRMVFQEVIELYAVLPEIKDTDTLKKSVDACKLYAMEKAVSALLTFIVNN